MFEGKIPRNSRTFCVNENNFRDKLFFVIYINRGVERVMMGRYSISYLYDDRHLTLSIYSYYLIGDFYVSVFSFKIVNDFANFNIYDEPFTTTSGSTLTSVATALDEDFVDGTCLPRRLGFCSRCPFAGTVLLVVADEFVVVPLVLLALLFTPAAVGGVVCLIATDVELLVLIGIPLPPAVISMVSVVPILVLFVFNFPLTGRNNE